MVSKLLKILALGAFLTLNLNAKTIKEGVLTIATEGTYAPFSYYDDKNELKGYDVDIARDFPLVALVNAEKGCVVRMATCNFEKFRLAFRDDTGLFLRQSGSRI